MDTQQQSGQQADGYGDESLNTGSTSADSQQSGEGQNNQHHHKKGGIHSNALYAASMGRAATAQVEAHHTEHLAQTGTNVSYEGATAPGGGGSSGTGFTSGQAGTGSSIAADSDYDQAAVGKHFDKAEGGADVADGADTTENEQS